MKRTLVVLCALTVLFLIASTAMAQDSLSILCPKCAQPNNRDNSFCTSCGEKLTDKTISAEQDQPFTYREPARLLSVPTADVLPQLSIGLTLGNSFGRQEQRSFLGTVSIGIGDVAELELNTSGMVANIIAGTTKMTTWALKVKLLSEQERLPAFAVSLRSSNDWDNARFDSQALDASGGDYYREGLRWLNYDMRMTTASLSVSRTVYEKTTLHATVGLSDIRYRNLSFQRVSYDYQYDPSVKRTNQWQAAGGFAFKVNSRTKVLAEVQTIPFLNYNVSRNELNFEHMYLGAAGIRFALSKAFTLDSGVRYQSNFVGLADTQVCVALNGIFMLPL